MTRGVTFFSPGSPSNGNMGWGREEEDLTCQWGGP